MRALRNSPFLSGYSPPAKPKSLAPTPTPTPTVTFTPIPTSTPTPAISVTPVSNPSSSLSPTLSNRHTVGLTTPTLTSNIPSTLQSSISTTKLLSNNPKKAHTTPTTSEGKDLQIPPPSEMKPFTPTVKMDDDRIIDAASKEIMYQIGLSDFCRNWESQFIYTSIEVEEAIGISENLDLLETNKIAENWHSKKISSIDQQLLHVPPVKLTYFFQTFKYFLITFFFLKKKYEFTLSAKYRRFVREGELLGLTSNGPTKLFCFLFSDFFLVTRFDNDESKYSLLDIIPVDQCIIKEG